MAYRPSAAYLASEQSLIGLPRIDRIAVIWENLPYHQRAMDPPIIEADNTAALRARELVYSLATEELDAFIEKHGDALEAQIYEAIESFLKAPEPVFADKAFIATALIGNGILKSKSLSNLFTGLGISNSNLTNAIDQWEKNDLAEVVTSTDSKEFKLTKSGQAKRKRMIKSLMKTISPD